MPEHDKKQVGQDTGNQRGQEDAPKLEPTEARQATVIFDSKKKRYRFVIFAAVLAIIYAVYYFALMR